jgi:hypothetical protein
LIFDGEKGSHKGERLRRRERWSERGYVSSIALCSPFGLFFIIYK